MLQDHPILKCLPAVFAVKNEYQIFTAFDCAALVKVRVGGDKVDIQVVFTHGTEGDRERFFSFAGRKIGLSFDDFVIDYGVFLLFVKKLNWNRNMVNVAV